MRNEQFLNEILPSLRAKIERLMQLKLFQHHQTSVLIPSARRSLDEKRDTMRTDQSDAEERPKRQRMPRDNSDLSLSSSHSLTERPPFKSYQALSNLDPVPDAQDAIGGSIKVLDGKDFSRMHENFGLEIKRIETEIQASLDPYCGLDTNVQVQTTNLFNTLNSQIMPPRPSRVAVLHQFKLDADRGKATAEGGGDINVAASQ